MLTKIVQNLLVVWHTHHKQDVYWLKTLNRDTSVSIYATLNINIIYFPKNVSLLGIFF